MTGPAALSNLYGLLDKAMSAGSENAYSKERLTWASEEVEDALAGFVDLSVDALASCDRSSLSRISEFYEGLVDAKIAGRLSDRDIDLLSFLLGVCSGVSAVSNEFGVRLSEETAYQQLLERVSSLGVAILDKLLSSAGRTSYVRQLERDLKRKSSTVFDNLKKLQSLGYVSKEAIGRKVYYRLTPKGVSEATFASAQLRLRELTLDKGFKASILRITELLSDMVQTKRLSARNMLAKLQDNYRINLLPDERELLRVYDELGRSIRRESLATRGFLADIGEPVINEAVSPLWKPTLILTPARGASVLSLQVRVPEWAATEQFRWLVDDKLVSLEYVSLSLIEEVARSYASSRGHRLEDVMRVFSFEEGSSTVPTIVESFVREEAEQG